MSTPDELVSLRARAERLPSSLRTPEQTAWILDRFKPDGLERLARADRWYTDSHGHYVPDLAALAHAALAALEAAERDRDDWREKCLAHREAFSEARAELAVTKSANVPITKLTGDAGVTTPETGSDNPQRRCAAASDTPAESVAVSEWRKASDLWQARAEDAEARLLAAQQALRDAEEVAQEIRGEVVPRTMEVRRARLWDRDPGEWTRYERKLADAVAAALVAVGRDPQ